MYWPCLFCSWFPSFVFFICLSIFLFATLKKTFSVVNRETLQLLRLRVRCRKEVCRRYQTSLERGQFSDGNYSGTIVEIFIREASSLKSWNISVHRNPLYVLFCKRSFSSQMFCLTLLYFLRCTLHNLRSVGVTFVFFHIVSCCKEDIRTIQLKSVMEYYFSSVFLVRIIQISHLRNVTF